MGSGGAAPAPPPCRRKHRRAQHLGQHKVGQHFRNMLAQEGGRDVLPSDPLLIGIVRHST